MDSHLRRERWMARMACVCEISNINNGHRIISGTNVGSGALIGDRTRRETLGMEPGWIGDVPFCLKACLFKGPCTVGLLASDVPPSNALLVSLGSMLWAL